MKVLCSLDNIFNKHLKMQFYLKCLILRNTIREIGMEVNGVTDERLLQRKQEKREQKCGSLIVFVSHSPACVRHMDVS